MIVFNVDKADMFHSHVIIAHDLGGILNVRRFSEVQDCTFL